MTWLDLLLANPTMEALYTGLPLDDARDLREECAGILEHEAGSLVASMRERLKRGGWRSPYRLRKQVVEPVFGQIKQAMGFRQFLLRGLAKAKAEWSLVCTAHNQSGVKRMGSPLSAPSWHTFRADQEHTSRGDSPTRD